MYSEFLIKFKLYLIIFKEFFFKYYLIVFLLCIFIYIFDFSYMFCDGDIKEFNELSQNEMNSNNNEISRFLSPFIKAGKGIKNGYNKVVSKIKKLDAKLEKWNKKDNKRYQIGIDIAQKNWERRQEHKRAINRIRLRAYYDYITSHK